MYCFIKYVAVLNLDQRFGSFSVSSQHSSKSNTVLENRELIINTNCPIQIIIDYISSEIGFDKNCDFDLCDELGQLVNVKSFKPWVYATEMLVPKITYFIVFLNRNENGQLEAVDPLLNRCSKQFSDIMIKLKRNISSLRRFSSEHKTKRDKSMHASSVWVDSNEQKRVRKRSSTKSTRSKKSTHS